MRRIPVTLIVTCALAAGALAQDSKVTVVTGRTTADGSSQVSERPLEECIVSLPAVSDMEADVSARSEFLKEIGGDASKNGHTRIYTAAVTVSYMVRQKFLLIVTTSSIEGKDPVIQEQERTVMMSRSFTSDPGGGDIFAGRSNRKYYYSTPEAAAASAKARAETWVKQQRSVMCAAVSGTK